MASGSTYYIKVRGFSTSTSGNFRLLFNRGKPNSTYEKGDLFGYFNNSDYIDYTNCYVYALGYWKDPISGARFRWNGQNPGEMSGDAIEMSDLVDADTARSAIIAILRKRTC